MPGVREWIRRTPVVAGLAALSLVLASCLGGDDAGSAHRNGKDSGSSGASGATVTADCSDAILGEGDPHWRQRSTVVGPFGLYGETNRDFSDLVPRPSGVFIAKLPTVIEGDDPVVLAVPDGERGRAGLLYGPSADVRSIPDAPAAVSFEPCPDRDVTGWAGGLVLSDRGSIDLQVLVERNDAATVTVGGALSAVEPGVGATVESDGAAILGHCSPAGEVPGVDGLPCDEARELLATWPDLRVISASLEPCDHEGAGFDHRADHAIGCERVNRFVSEDFAPHPPGWFERKNGFTCRIRELGGGGLTVGCTDGEKWFSFKFA
jgi:hypothetical protein